MSRTDSIFVFKATVPEEREACFAIRREVFVEEQKVPLEIELDEHEDEALHFLALHDKKSIGTARVLLKDDGLVAKIGRVAVLASHRGQGVGLAIMQAVEADPIVREAARLVLHSQTHALPFYKKLGYQISGEEFIEDGIPHYFMSKDNREVIRSLKAHAG